jgi:hypothetical protein
MTTLEIVRYALDVLPYLLMAGTTFLAVWAKTKLDEIAYLLWVIIFMLVIIADKVAK